MNTIERAVCVKPYSETLQIGSLPSAVHDSVSQVNSWLAQPDPTEYLLDAKNFMQCMPVYRDFFTAALKAQFPDYLLDISLCCEATSVSSVKVWYLPCGRPWSEAEELGGIDLSFIEDGWRDDVFACYCIKKLGLQIDHWQAVTRAAGLEVARYKKIIAAMADVQLQSWANAAHKKNCRAFGALFFLETVLCLIGSTLAKNESKCNCVHGETLDSFLYNRDICI